MRKSRIKEDILNAVSSGEVVSGGEIASMLGVSRTAVWKAVNALRADGYRITGLGGGYVLAPENTRLCGGQLCAVTGENIIFKEETLSTNEDIKALAEAGGEEFLTVAARRQTGGKGRMGRQFESPEGGLYFSLLLRPGFSAETCLKITTAAAVAMARALEKVSGRKAQIKWVNDIYIDNKKVCGILTEGAFDAGDPTLKYAVLGIGANIAAPAGGFSAKIKEKAGSLFAARAVPSLVYCAVIKEFLGAFKEYYKNIEDMPHIEEYRRRSYLEGKEITYKSGEKLYTATVCGISDTGGLIVKRRHKTVILTSGEAEIKNYE